MRRINWSREYIRILIICLVAGIMIGVFVGNKMQGLYQTKSGIFSEYDLQRYRYGETSGAELFIHIAPLRIKWILLIWCMGMTACAEFFVAASILWFGFSMGLMATMVYVRFGVAGFGFFAGAMFPHVFIYLPVWCVFLNYVYLRKGGKHRPDVKDILILGLVLACILLGIMTESYVNPTILRQLVKLF